MKNQTVNIDTQIKREGPSEETKQALWQSDVQRDIADIKKLATSIQESLDKNYVTKSEFKPVQDGLKGMQGFFYTIGTASILIIVGGFFKIIFKI